jgi:ribonuclease HI
MLSLYADGGVIKKNPSRIGGTWAWCLVNEANERVKEASGHVTPAQLSQHELTNFEVVTNNVTELLAVILGMEALEAGWGGIIYTDSMVTLRRINKKAVKPPGMAGVPTFLVRRLAASQCRLGDYTTILLGGHPTRKELADGKRRDGLPCSPHNCYCDRLCGATGKKFLASLEELRSHDVIG